MRLFLLALSLCTLAEASFLEENPKLKDHIPKEEKSNFWIGAGVGPVGILSNRALHSLSPFQLHWISGHFDWEIINASLGLTSFSKESFTKARHFFFRTAPKLRLLNFLSVGPLLGYEYVSYPDIGVRITKGTFTNVPLEPFSSSGVIYGVEITQTFQLGEYFLKVAEVIFKQTYSTTTTRNGWTYEFDKPEIENDPARTLIKPSVVFLLEFSFLF